MMKKTIMGIIFLTIICGTSYVIGEQVKTISNKIHIENTSVESLKTIVNSETENNDKKLKAIEIMGETTERKKEVAEILRNTLQNKNEKLKIEAAVSLYKIGEEAEIVLPMLDNYIKTGHRDILDKLIKQKDCGKIDSGHIYQVEGLYNDNGKVILKNALKYDDITQAKAAYWLTWAGEDKIALENAKMILEKSNNVEAKLISLKTLARIKDAKVKDIIKQALKDENQTVRDRAVWMLDYLKNKENQKNILNKQK